MDFIGLLSITKAGNRYILNIVCYFSRFIVPFACPNDKAGDVIRCLRQFFIFYRTPYAFYTDLGTHFNNDAVRNFFKQEETTITYSPSGASKSTGMVEVCNKLLEQVLRKDSSEFEWDERIQNAAKSVNTRHISYFNFSPTSILFGLLQREATASAAILLRLPGRDI